MRSCWRCKEGSGYPRLGCLRLVSRASVCACLWVCVSTPRACCRAPGVMDFRAGYLSGFKEQTFIWGPPRLWWPCSSWLPGSIQELFGDLDPLFNRSEDPALFQAPPRELKHVLRSYSVPCLSEHILFIIHLIFFVDLLGIILWGHVCVHLAALSSLFLTSSLPSLFCVFCAWLVFLPLAAFF